MSKRAIIRDLLAHRIPERVGLNEHFWPHIIDNAWGSQGIECENWVERFDLDIRNLCWFNVPGPSPDLAGRVREDAETVVERDAWGATFRTWKGKSGTPEHLGFTCSTPEAWRQDFREQTIALNVRRHDDLATLRANYATCQAKDEFLTFGGLFVFEELRKILGDVAMLESLAAEPAFVNDICEVLTAKHIEHWNWIFANVGKPDGMHIYEDLGYTKGPFCSPRMHRSLIHPHHKRFFGFLKDHGLPLIVHTCGDFRPHLTALHEAGADCIQALEAKTGMDIVKMASEWKDKLCFMGNLDIRAFESGDRTRIRDEVLYKLNGMREQRAPYIFMSDHSIPPSVRVDDYRFGLELYRANNRY